MIFRKGEIIRRVDENEMFDVLKQEIDQLLVERRQEGELVAT